MRGEKSPIAGPLFDLIFTPHGAAGDRDVEAMGGKPDESVSRGRECTNAALLLMTLRRVVIERNSDRQARAVAFVEIDQFLFVPHHRTHGIGQHQRLEPPSERLLQHGEYVWIHERLATRKSDLAGPKAGRLK